MLEKTLAVVLGYLIGAIPSAFLIIKLFAKKDILSDGTGNAGAMNSYEVTGKKYIGIMVFLADLLKGILAVIIGSLISQGDFLIIGITAAWSVIGHNFNFFFGLKGGRGLATTTGVFFALNPYPVIAWVLVWLASYYIIRKNVHIANAAACLGAPLMMFSTNNQLIALMNIQQIPDLFQLKILVTVLSFIILLRHIQPLKELVKVK
jgi:glycerol-3-phosphate acyltransferase PlsY